MTKLASWWVAGRLHVEGIPRGNWEGDVAYYKRVAQYYTTMHGEYGRDMNLCHSYKMGDKVESLALDYGVSTTTVRSILRKHNVPIRNARPPIDPNRNWEIYKRRLAKQTFSAIAKDFNLSHDRVRQIYDDMKRKAHKIARMKPKSRIVEPSPDLLDTWLVSETWTPEMQVMEFERHRGIDIT